MNVFGKLPGGASLRRGDLISGPATVTQAIRGGTHCRRGHAAQLQGSPALISPPQSGAVTFEELQLAGWPGLAAQGRLKILPPKRKGAWGAAPYLLRPLLPLLPRSGRNSRIKAATCLI